MKEFQRPAPLLKGQRGAAVIEFALVLIFLVLPLLVGIIEFSILYYNKAIITNASREGARAGISVLNVPRLDEAAIRDVVNGYAAKNLITFGESNDPETETQPDDGIPDSSVEHPQLSVTVTYTYDYLVLPRFVREVTKDFLTLSATTVMEYEG